MKHISNRTTGRMAAVAGMVIAAMAAVLSSFAAAGDTGITIYSSVNPQQVPDWLYHAPAADRDRSSVPGFALVRERREIPLKQGDQPVAITGVAAGIDPASAIFRFADDSQAGVQALSYRFDLASRQHLLQRYIGKAVVVEQSRGTEIDTLEGVLRGLDDGLMLELDDGSILNVSDYQNIRFPDPQRELVREPTLMLRVVAAAAGDRQLEFSYQTGGMTWWPDYNAVLAPAGFGCTLALTAWVNLVNHSGGDFAQAALQLVAGDVRRQPRGSGMQRMARAEAMESQLPAEGFAEQSFNEYHLYRLERAIDLPRQSVQQVQLFAPANGIPCRRLLVVDGSPGYFGGQQLSDSFTGAAELDAKVIYEITNDAGSGLDRPLPAGRIRVLQRHDAAGGMTLVGVDGIGHTPRDETLRLHTGNAFDVKANRKQTDFRIDSRTRELWESWQIEIRNRKQEPETVIVNENLFRAANWEITESSHDYTRVNSNRVRFELRAGAGEAAVLTYTAHYRY